MKSYLAKANEVERKWYVVDVAEKPLGRAASQIASILRGKNKPIYTPNVDTGDYVIVLNTDKIVLTGKKADQKMFRHHTLYPGGLKEMTYKDAIAKKSDFVFYEAVRRMLPHGVLGRQMLKKLKVYKGEEHDHEAQKPETLELRY
ncbi:MULTISPECIES: 50S ribosomal protein L13 [Clostridium]|uniref:50S ribosomal protein L13 n=1 Tax=Clostridium TaxID=1485 RepID=UPI0008244A64|nr:MULTISPECIES: 50S ribosomal protein L13 [Clostridium]PJI08910.1 50S ribosomal protein L13 [Clostridium sp. CT7]